MRDVRICIGSACHLKGSYEVIEIFQSIIKEMELDEKIELKAAFCLGRCTEAVSLERWDGEIFSASKDNAREVFKKHILVEILEEDDGCN
jgi:NADH:ubiquinone oxidoreductase subunit E